MVRVRHGRLVKRLRNRRATERWTAVTRLPRGRDAVTITQQGTTLFQRRLKIRSG
jgi:hypothetical protein